MNEMTNSTTANALPNFLNAADVAAWRTAQLAEAGEFHADELDAYIAEATDEALRADALARLAERFPRVVARLASVLWMPVAEPTNLLRAEWVAALPDRDTLRLSVVNDRVWLARYGLAGERLADYNV